MVQYPITRNREFLKEVATQRIFWQFLKSHCEHYAIALAKAGAWQSRGQGRVCCPWIASPPAPLGLMRDSQWHLRLFRDIMKRCWVVTKKVIIPIAVRVGLGLSLRRHVGESWGPEGTWTTGARLWAARFWDRLSFRMFRKTNIWRRAPWRVLNIWRGWWTVF